MNKKAKIIYGDPDSCDKELNNFLKENSHIKILSVTQSGTAYSAVVLTIIYEEYPKEETSSTQMRDW